MIYVISDIHGEYGLFMRLLDSIKFSGSDTLISCGDIIDKGQDSARLLKFISSMPNAKCINGNHEYDFLKYYWSLMRQSTGDYGSVLKKLQACFPDGNLLDWQTVDWVESRPYYIEQDNFICVHAGVPLDGNGRVLPLERATREQLVYDRNFKNPNIRVNGSKCVFFGHTPTSYLLNGDSRIIAYPKFDASGSGTKITDFYKIHLDTGTSLDGVLGCFCIDNCMAYYVKQ